MGRDKQAFDTHIKAPSFNSRAPHGARRFAIVAITHITMFQFTRPAWGATIAHFRSPFLVFVSIHAPRMGRDVGYCNTFSRNGKGE